MHQLLGRLVEEPRLRRGFTSRLPTGVGRVTLCAVDAADAIQQGGVAARTLGAENGRANGAQRRHGGARCRRAVGASAPAQCSSGAAPRLRPARRSRPLTGMTGGVAPPKCGHPSPQRPPFPDHTVSWLHSAFRLLITRGPTMLRVTLRVPSASLGRHRRRHRPSAACPRVTATEVSCPGWARPTGTTAASAC
jgi:hypothetical protein